MYEEFFEFENVTFYPGSFSPFHQGHLSCIQLFLSLFPLRRLIILPDRNPQKFSKTGPKTKDEPGILSSYKQLKEIEVLEGYEIYPYLLKTGKINKTWDWISKSKRPSLLIGEDNWRSFSTWENYEDILSYLENLFIVPRSFSQTEKKGEMMKKEKFPNLKINFLPKHQFMNLSSTRLRNKS